MSGHSKWANIQVRKGVMDKKRGKTFTKLAKAVTVAAREGGGDMTANMRLRAAVDAAKEANMPKDNIERAIARGTGAGEGMEVKEVLYEAFGPGGVALMIGCMSDNPNRTVAELKTLLSKNGGNMAGTGSVAWMFERRGIIVVADVASLADRDGFDMSLIEAGALDIQDIQDGVKILCEVKDLHRVREALQAVGREPASLTIAYVPKETVAVTDEVVSKALDGLLALLEAHDDVDEVFTNWG